jgi:hypothetical protein
MANNRELSQFGSFVNIDDTTRNVGIATTVRITSGGLFVGAVQAIRADGTWGGSSAGIQGAQGTTGTQGIQGITGTQGTQGIQGLTGAQGATGSQGTTGAQGATGTQGSTGSQGTQGSTGTQGTAGSTGSQGIQGRQGTQGTQGITGPTGGTDGQVLYRSGGSATSSSNLTFDGTTFRFNNGYGSAFVAYGCRAWVAFDGTNLSIRASGNVSSIGRVGTGQYNVNFSSSLSDNNYSVLVSVRAPSDTLPGGGEWYAGTRSTSTITVSTGNAANYYDPPVVSVAVMR